MKTKQRVWNFANFPGTYETWCEPEGEGNKCEKGLLNPFTEPSFREQNMQDFEARIKNKHRRELITINQDGG